MEKDFYQILEIDPACSQEELNEAANRLISSLNARSDYDDKRRSVMLPLIRKACNVLRDPIKRLEYDIQRGYRKSSVSQTPLGTKDPPPIGIRYSESVETLETVKIPGAFDYDRIARPIEAMETAFSRKIYAQDDVKVGSGSLLNLPHSSRSLDSILKDKNSTEELSKYSENFNTGEYHTKIVDLPNTELSRSKIGSRTSSLRAITEKDERKSTSFSKNSPISNEEEGQSSRSVESSPELLDEESSNVKVGLNETNYSVSEEKRNSLSTVSKELHMGEERKIITDSDTGSVTSVSTDTEESRNLAEDTLVDSKRKADGIKSKLPRRKSFSTEKLHEFLQLKPKTVDTHEGKTSHSLTEFEQREPQKVDEDYLRDEPSGSKISPTSPDISAKHVDSFEIIKRTIRRLTDPIIFKSQHSRSHSRSLSYEKDAGKLLREKFHTSSNIKAPKSSSAVVKTSRRTSFSEVPEIIDSEANQTPLDEDSLEDSEKQYPEAHDSKILEEIRSLVNVLKQSVITCEAKCSCSEHDTKARELASKTPEYDTKTLPTERTPNHDQEESVTRPGGSTELATETKLIHKYSTSSESQDIPEKGEDRLKSTFETLPYCSKSPTIDKITVETKKFVSRSSDLVISQADKLSVAEKAKKVPIENTVNTKYENAGKTTLVPPPGFQQKEEPDDIASKYFIPRRSLEILQDLNEDLRPNIEFYPDFHRPETSAAEGIIIGTQKIFSEPSVQISSKQEKQFSGSEGILIGTRKIFSDDSQSAVQISSKQEKQISGSEKQQTSKKEKKQLDWRQFFSGTSAMTSQTARGTTPDKTRDLKSVSATTRAAGVDIKTVYHYGPSSDFIEVFIDGEMRARIVKDRAHVTYSNAMNYDDKPPGADVSASTIIEANGCVIRTEISREDKRETIAVYKDNELLYRAGSTILQ